MLTPYNNTPWLLRLRVGIIKDSGGVVTEQVQFAGYQAGVQLTGRRGGKLLLIDNIPYH